MGLTMSDLKWIHIWLNDIQVACPSFIVQQVIWKKKRILETLSMTVSGSTNKYSSTTLTL